MHGAMRIARTLDLAGEGLLVEALGVAVLDNVERGVGKDLNEGDAGIGVQLASGIAVSAEGRDERGDRNVAGISKELGHLLRQCVSGAARERAETHLRDAADVLLAIGIGEAEVLVEAEANVVAVEAVRVDT